VRHGTAGNVRENDTPDTRRDTAVAFVVIEAGFFAAFAQ
jgi:hypothetical protein